MQTAWLPQVFQQTARSHRAVVRQTKCRGCVRPAFAIVIQVVRSQKSRRSHARIAASFAAKLFLDPDKSRPRCACASYEAARASDFSPPGRPQRAREGWSWQCKSQMDAGALTQPWRLVRVLDCAGPEAQPRAPAHRQGAWRHRGRRRRLSTRQTGERPQNIPSRRSRSLRFSARHNSP